MCSVTPAPTSVLPLRVKPEKALSAEMVPGVATVSAGAGAAPMRTLTLPDKPLLLPAASVATARQACAPSAGVCTSDQAPLPFAVVVPTGVLAPSR
jgi:hypothetical protein